MDGGLRPETPEEVLPTDDLGDMSNGVIFEGTKGKLLGNYSKEPMLLPSSRNEEIATVPKTLKRVPEGHYVDWVNACLAGYGNHEVSSPFEYAGPFTEAVIMGNLAIRSYQLQKGRNEYPGRKKLYWDAKNMKITNFDEANAFVMRENRKGW
jgi:hypothetical protein